MNYFCCEKKRRHLLIAANAARAAASPPQPALNGIDFLEVLDREAPAGLDRQRTLLVHFFAPVPNFAPGQLSIRGGERIPEVEIEWSARADQLAQPPATAADATFAGTLPTPDQVLIVRTVSTGDFSTYRLSLFDTADPELTPPGFDPLFCAVDFSFKVECPSDFDCRNARVCPPPPPAPPPLDYLAKDYASFRRMLLDRLAVLMPGWRERSPADFGVTLVELFAYVADQLSYQQDAAATEAYLGTARRRSSVRRHARLLDYLMHDGCNARTWVHVTAAAGANGTLLPARTPLLTRTPGASNRIAPNTEGLSRVLLAKPVVFETRRAVALYSAHNELRFHTWGDERCCLPKGATRATLQGHLPKLVAGDLLLIEEVCGAHTGVAGDADRQKRHVVRLTRVRPWASPGVALTDPLTTDEITEIAWDEADALPMAFTIDQVTPPGGQSSTPVTVARGNIVLADHGQTFRNEALGRVPQPNLFQAEPGRGHCDTPQPEPVPPRFAPVLPRSPLTQELPDTPDRPAVAEQEVHLTRALPHLELESRLGARVETWSPVRDLFGAQRDHTIFMVEVERDGAARVKFGQGQHGRRPDPGAEFVAKRFRIGNGAAGNIGADAIAHCVTNEAVVAAVRNPVPAWGGTDPETMEDVRQRAPAAFRHQLRAVTEADYATVTARDPQVQQAQATLRWTGSWHTMYVTADRRGGRRVDAAFRLATRQRLESFRLAGHDLEFDSPRPVSLEIVLHVCVDGAYFRTQVKAALLDVFSNRLRADGRRGVFHPDNFSFGQPVFLSVIYAAAQAVTGVTSVHALVFQRLGKPETSGLASGRLTFGRLEVPRCDNDPNFQENGLFRLEIGGGK